MYQYIVQTNESYTLRIIRQQKNVMAHSRIYYATGAVAQIPFPSVGSSSASNNSHRKWPRGNRVMQLQSADDC